MSIVFPNMNVVYMENTLLSPIFFTNKNGLKLIRYNNADERTRPSVRDRLSQFYVQQCDVPGIYLSKGNAEPKELKLVIFPAQLSAWAKVVPLGRRGSMFGHVVIAPTFTLRGEEPPLSTHLEDPTSASQSIRPKP